VIFFFGGAYINTSVLSWAKANKQWQWQRENNRKLNEINSNGSGGSAKSNHNKQQ